MPIPGNSNPAGDQQTGSAGKSSFQLPFVQSSSDLTQQFGSSQVIAPASWAGVTPVGPLDILSLGYLRGIWVEVAATGGVSAGNAVTYVADAPWTLIQTGQLTDSVNAPFVGPHGGYDLYIMTKYGSYANGDPKQDPDYVAPSVVGNFAFRLFLPAEVLRRIGLGSLPNQNSAATNKITLYIADPSAVYVVQPTTLPTLTIRFYLDAWNSVPLHDVAGNMLTQTPPGGKLRQYWTESTFNAIPSGQYELQLVRKGYYFRQLIFVCRNAEGVRSDSVFPNPVQWTVDGNTRSFIYPALLRKQMQDDYGYYGTLDAAGALDTGVYILNFANDFDRNSRRGGDLRTKWMPSLKASNYWFQGSWGGGSAIVITNDVAPDPNSSVWLPEPLLL